MDIINKNKYRTLEGTVDVLVDAVNQHYNVDRVLTDWGIRVVGRADTYEELLEIANPETYTGAFGNAYAVGVEAPFDYYVWTRADINSGQPNNYWLNIGGLTIAGPQGPQGLPGEQGPAGEAADIYIYYNANAANYGPPTSLDENYKMGVNLAKGKVYRRSGRRWAAVAGSIIGPQGIQGPQGPQGLQGPQGPRGLQGLQGPPGLAVVIRGILNDIDDLPNPNTVSRDSAYILKISGINYTYIIVDSIDPETQVTTLTWKSAGIFGAGSLVVNDYDEPIPTLNIDDYCHKPALSTGDDISIAAYDNSGRQVVLNATNKAIPGAGELPITDAAGNIRSGIPNDYNDVVVLGYLDDNKFIKKPDDSPNNYPSDQRNRIPVYVPNANSWRVDYKPVSLNADYECIVQRDTSGNILTPTEQVFDGTSDVAISMRVADETFMKTLYQHHKILVADYQGRSLEIHWDYYSPSSTPENFTTASGTALYQGLFKYTACNGFYKFTVGSTEYNTLINGIHPNSDMLKLTGIQVVKTGSTYIPTIKDFSSTIDLLYTGFTSATITDTVTPV